MELSQSLKSTGSVAADFGRAVLDSAVLTPYEGVAQLVNRVAHRDVLPEVQLPKAHAVAFTDAHWQAEVFGQAVGTALQVAALSKLCSRFGGAAAESGTLQASKLAGRLTLPQAAASGFVLGSVFQPVENNDKNFWRDRLANGGSTAAALTAFSYLGERFDGAARARTGLTTPGLSLPLRLDLRNNIGAGALAGLVGAETNSLFRGQGQASPQDLAAGAYSFAVTGGLLTGYYRANRAFEGNSQRFAGSDDLQRAPLRSTLLSYISRTQEPLRPAGLDSYNASLPRWEFGLPDKNVDLTVWAKGSERQQVLDYMRAESVGVFGNDANIAAFVRELDQARVGQLGRELGEAHAAGDAAQVEQARQRLQGALTEATTAFTTSHGLPPLEVELLNNLPPKVMGVYQVGTNKLLFNEQLLERGLTADVVDFLSHEGTHFEQDTYRQMKARGEALTPEQEQRLARVEDSRDELAQLPGPEQIMAIDRALKDTSAKWGDLTPDQQAQIMAQMPDLYKFRQEAANNYVGVQFEREAWANGVLAHLKARALGLPAPATDPTLFSEPR